MKIRQNIRKYLKKLTRRFHKEAYEQLDELIKKSYTSTFQRNIESNELEQLKDIYFGDILNSAIDKNQTIENILRQMVNGIEVYFRNEVIVSLHEIIRLPKNKFEELLLREGIGYDHILHDIDGQPLAAYCLMDTFLDKKLYELTDEERTYTVREDSIIGQTYNLGEGIVFIDESLLEDENIKKTRVKRIHYRSMKPSKWFSLRMKMGYNETSEYDKKELAYPVYNHDLKNPDINYVILIDSKTYSQFSPSQIRAVRGFETYTASSIKIKKLNEILNEVRRKNRQLDEKDKKLVQNLATGAHSIKTPLSIMTYTIEGIQQFLESGSPPSSEQIKAGLSRLIHAYEQILERVLTLDDSAMKYEMNPYPFDSFVKEVLYLDFKEGTTYGQYVNFQFDLKAKDDGQNDLNVMLDRVQFRKVLYDMIINTYEKCIEDNKKAFFTVKTRTHGGYVSALFHDNLGGMPDTQFVEFKNTDGCQTTKKKGSGIGTKTIKKYFADINEYHKRDYIKFYPVNQHHKGFGIYIKIPISQPGDPRYTFFVPI